MAHRSLYADDPFMTALIAAFIQRLAEHARAIRRYAAAQERENLRQILHQLKGAGASYGFPPISTHAAAAEEAIIAGEPLAIVWQSLTPLLDYIEQIEHYPGP